MATKTAAKAKTPAPAPEPENEYVTELPTGTVVSYETDEDKTVVEFKDGSVETVDGDHYDNAVAVATLFRL